MRFLLNMLILCTFMWTLTACGRSSEAEAAAVADAAQSSDGAVVAPDVPADGAVAAAPANPVPPAAEDAIQGSDSVTVTAQNGADNALPLSTQLAVGTLLLEETELAVDAEQAGALLPLWQEMQTATLGNPTADVTRIATQIQAAMTIEQLDTITSMGLTPEGMQQMMQNGELEFELPGAGAPNGPPNGQPEGLTQGQPGTQPNGRPGGQPGDVDPDALATRQAERVAQGGNAELPGGPNSGLRNNLFVGAVIGLLESKV